MMKRGLSVFLGLALCAAGALSLSRCRPAEAADPLLSALRPEWVKIEADRRITAYNRLVLVIGENHDSNQGQKDLAALLERLLDEQLIEAILVEGSAGPIDIRDLISTLAQEAPGADLAAYWRSQLEWGQISGWEFVALTRPQVPAQGVEDMVAKRRFAITELSLSDDTMRRQLASWERGGGVLEAAIAALEQAGVAQPKARSALGEYRQRIRTFAAAAERFGALRKPVVARELERLETAVQIELILDETGLAALRDQPDAEQLFQQKMEQLQAEQPDQFLRLISLFEKSQSLAQDQGEPSPELEAAAEEMGERLEEIQGAYFSLANDLRADTEKQWKGLDASVPAEVAQALRKVESFFGDEQKRIGEEHKAGARAILAERDRAMAANTDQYLSDQPVTRVALIVGANHLEGMMAELGERNLPFIAGKLVAEDSEPWEEAAWERRQKTAQKIWQDGEIKEMSRLLDPDWRDNQIKLVRQMFPAAEAKLQTSENAGLLYRSDQLPAERVPRGAQVVAFGPDPANPRQVFEKWSEEISRGYVSTLSADWIPVVFGYQKRDPQNRLQYKLVTPQGERTLEEFRTLAPGEKGKQPPDYVLLFHVPDVKMESGIPRSPLLWQLRTGGGGRGDGGGLPPKGPRGTAGPDENGNNGKGNKGRGDKGGEGGNGDGRKPPFWTALGGGGGEGRRPRLIRTLNPERARRSLETVRSQKPLEPSEVQFLENPAELKNVYFAEKDGSYAGMVVLAAHNGAEFRAAVREAADLQKLQNKQVVLITCGDLFTETTALREHLLESGALMVWTPDRQLTPEIGRKLRDQIQETLQKSEDSGDKPQDIDQLIDRSIIDLIEAEPENKQLEILLESSSWAELLQTAGEVEEERQA
jgi:hypothetical protein